MSEVARIEVVPQRALVDQTLRIRLHGLNPNQVVTLRASLRDDFERQWSSHATYQASAQGVVDLNSQEPLVGTYSGVDPMGLFWSMALDTVDDGPPTTKKTVDSTTVVLTAEVNGRAVATTTVQQLFVADEVVRLPVRENGIVGTFFQPAGQGPFPAAMYLTGSGGGLPEVTAAMLASYGYACLSVAYFAFEQLPSNLVNIPLEYFETAIQWLQRQPTVNRNRLALVGGSRGGELALLLAATFPAVIKAVVAYVPSALVWGGVGAANSGTNEPAWTYGAKPLPFIARASLPAESLTGSSELMHTAPLFVSAMQDPAAVIRATIPLERVRGPIMLISGKDDGMWPSTLFSEMIMQRLAERQHPFQDEHVSYEGAGHIMPLPPNMPTTKTQVRHSVRGYMVSIGGNAKENAFARADSWLRLLQFLDRHLRS